MRDRWTGATDRALLAAAATNVDALDAFYRRHEALVAAYLHRRTRDPHRTADLAAEVFAQALLRPHSFTGGTPEAPARLGADGSAREDASAAGWLLGIARNLHLRSLRDDDVERRAVARLGAQSPRYADDDARRLDVLLGDEVRPLLLSALAKLPENQRQAIVAYVVDELSYAELAAQLDLPEATVRKRVSRGLSRLRTTIGARP